MKIELSENDSLPITPVFAAVMISLNLSSTAAGAAPLAFRVDTDDEKLNEAGGKHIAMDATGNSVMVWGTYYYIVGEDSQPAVLFRRYNAAGAPLTEPIVASLELDPGEIPAPSTAGNGAGNFVIVWFSGSEVLALRYGPGGVKLGSEITVNTSTTDEFSRTPRVGIATNGDFVVTWIIGDVLHGRAFAADGNPLTAELTLSDQPVDSGTTGDVAVAADGSFAVTWLSEGRVFTRRFAANGTATGASSRVDRAPEDDLDFEGDDSQIETTLTNPVIAMDATGDFAIAWNSDQAATLRVVQHIPRKCFGRGPYRECYDAYDRFAYRVNLRSTVRFRRYTSNGAAVSTTDTEVAGFSSIVNYNEYDSDWRFKTITDLNSPAIAMDQTGNFTVAWEAAVTKQKKIVERYGGYTYVYFEDTTTSSILTRKFKADGNSGGKAVTAIKASPSSPENIAPSVAIDDNGDMGVTWCQRETETYVYEGGYYKYYLDELWGKITPAKKKKK